MIFTKFPPIPTRHQEQAEVEVQNRGNWISLLLSSIYAEKSAVLLLGATTIVHYLLSWYWVVSDLTFFPWIMFSSIQFGQILT